MAKKFSFEEVKAHFEANGCILLSKEYINSKTSLYYICECGEKNFIKFELFKKGSRCRKCSFIKTANKKRIGYKEIKKIFEEKSCILISQEYKNNKEPLEYICRCGNLATSSLLGFRKSGKCTKCANNQRMSYEDVSRKFNDANCILLSKEYINKNTKLEFICSCGERHSTTLSSFSKSLRCYNCRNKAIGESKRHSYEYVKEAFDEKGLTLLSKEYIKGSMLLDYICVCGKQGKIRFNDMQKGVKCRDCSNKYLSELFSGENHHNYNHDLSEEERLDKRSYTEYRLWRNQVYERDDYTCQCCKDRGYSIVAHHKDGYHWCKERRTDMDNGVTLCEDCHLLFHTLYGRKNNTEYQYNEFESKYINGEFRDVV
ncbi:HNH endonuclease [Lysinibacillus sp. NPDC093712]|uniref:HNH endonuclease n=1 Tax=Lysinibacillus sp. NPDC093712 TaxID=3390579 RepID=UPI003D00085B